MYDARINIALGSLYFKKMLDRFNGNRILAIASYNAGPTRVSRWRKKTGGSIPFDAWIEVESDMGRDGRYILYQILDRWGNLQERWWSDGGAMMER